jgi:hypothetical protein
MKTFILSEGKLDSLKKTIIAESYGDKVLLVKKYLDDNYMRATFEKQGDDGSIKTMGIFVQLNDKHLPTDSRLMADGVFDILQNKFVKILGDKGERDRFLIQVIKDWYDNRISKEGCLSRYDF